MPLGRHTTSGHLREVGDLNSVWYVGPRQDQHAAWDANHALAGAAPAPRREIAGGKIGDIGTDDRKVAGFHFDDVRAGMTSRAVCCRSRWTEFSNKHNFKRYYSNVHCQI